MMAISAAEALWRARMDGTKVPRDFDGLPTNEDEAYAIQREMIALSGQEVIGWKIGATAEPLLKAIGVSQPFIGPLFGDFLHQSKAEIPFREGYRLEAEFTLQLDADLPHRAQAYTREEVMGALGAVIPSFEVVNFRFEGPPQGAGVRLIADGGANVGIITGPKVTERMDVDLKTLPATLSVNGEVVVTGSPEDLMWDHIFEAAGWLANHKAMAGRGLRAGDLIMTGSCTGMHPLNAGDQVTGDFGPLGKVEATFSG